MTSKSKIRSNARSFSDGWNGCQPLTMRGNAESDIDRLESVEVRFRYPNDADSPKSIFKITDLGHSVKAMVGGEWIL